MCTEPREVIVTHYADAPYEEMLDRQRRLFSEKVSLSRQGAATAPDHILTVEHRPVITLGRHADRANVLVSKEMLAQRGVDLVPIERGGDVTYHGPGQLVVYPIIDLQAYRLGVKQYVNLLEESVIRFIARYGIKGERVDGATGVWIGVGTPQERKICAIGIKCSRFITMHGLALNINTNLDGFTLINPCGFIDKGVTSVLAETGQRLDVEQSGKDLAAILIALLRTK